MSRFLLSITAIAALIVSSPASATGHFPHESGKVGDWFWKDVEGFYTAHVLGQRRPGEMFVVFCNDPNSRGSVAFRAGVKASQVGEERLSLRFENGTSIDVIADYGRVSAKTSTGQQIIGNVMRQLRSAGRVEVIQAGAPIARYSLKGSTAALKRCP